MPVRRARVGIDDPFMPGRVQRQHMQGAQWSAHWHCRMTNRCEERGAIQLGQSGGRAVLRSLQERSRSGRGVWSIRRRHGCIRSLGHPVAPGVMALSLQYRVPTEEIVPPYCETEPEPTRASEWCRFSLFGCCYEGFTPSSVDPQRHQANRKLPR